MKTNNLKALLYLSYVGFLLYSGVKLSSLSILWPIGQIILGFFSWHCFIILHSCGHQAFFPSHQLNTLTAQLASVFCLIPASSWITIHREHHKWSGWRDLDPTMSAINKKYPHFITIIMDWCWKYWIPIFTPIYLLTTFWNPMKWEKVEIIKPVKIYIEALCLICIYLWLYKQTWFFTYVPMAILVFFSIGDLSLLCQHVHLPQMESNDEEVSPLSPSEQTEFARELEMPYWVELLLFGRFNRHASHHQEPRVPPYGDFQNSAKQPHQQNALHWLKEAKTMKASQLLLEIPRKT
jgi:acyl-lipid omega-6 desaturase (Delta-12 desaturase)